MKCIVLACLVVFLCILPLAAQDPSTEYWQGFNSYSSYQLSSFESVNLDNFVLTLNIPIVSYPQRGTLPQLSITVHYKSNTWFQKWIQNPDGSSYYQWTPSPGPVGGVSGPGITSSVGAGEGNRRFESPGMPVYYEYYVTTSDGSIHNLGSTSGGLVAIDSSGWSVNSTGLTDKNGIAYGYITKSGVTVVASDPTGNAITSASTGSAAYIDSVGRRVPVPYWAQVSTMTPGSYTLTYPGMNGGNYAVTYVFASYPISTTFGDPCCLEFRGVNATLLQSINLPNGTKWTFTYNNFGDLSSVSTPTGGSVSYTWTNADVTGSNDYATFARVLSTRGVNADDGTGAKTWTYGTVKPGGSSGTAYPGFTDPDGNITAYTSTIRPDLGSLAIPTTKQYYQFTLAGQAQTLLKTSYTYYTFGYSPFCGGAAGASNDTGLTNFLPQYETITLPNGQGTLVRKVTFIYDSGATFSDPNSPATIQAWCGPETNSFPLVYGSLFQKQETDYGSGASGSILRNTVTQYEWQTNSSYLAHGMLNRPSQVTIYDSTNNTCEGLSNPCAQTTYAYDETTNGSQCTTLPCGNLTSETHWLSTGGSPKTQYVYNSQGMRTKTCDPIDTACQNPTITTYDSSGLFLSEVQYPNTGSTTHTKFFNYDLNTGRLNWQKDQNGQQTSYTYDSMWRLATRSYPDGGSETYTYNDTVSYPNSPSFTLTKKITSSTNFVQLGIVDGLGRPITTKTTVPTSTCSAGYAYVSTTYDNEGRKFSVSNPYCTTSDPTYGVTKTYYDMLSRPCLVVSPDGTPPSTSSCPATNPGNDILTTYSGNCTTVADQANITRTSCSDGLGRMVKILEDPTHLNYETDYTYDALGNLLKVLQGGSHQRTFSYDTLSRLVSAQNPESGTICYAAYSGGVCQNQNGYDANGNLLTKTDGRGITINYNYDALDRLTSKTYSDSTPAINYSYDGVAPTACTIPGSFNYGSYPKPHRTAMCDAAGNEAWSYDLMGRPVLDQRTTNGHTLTFTDSSYNLDGSLAKLSYPSGHAISLTYNQGEQQTSAVDNTGTTINYAVGPVTCPNLQSSSNLACYTPFGSIASFQNGSSLIFTALYNKRLQPCRIDVRTSSTAPGGCTLSSDAGNVMDLSYSFDLSTGNPSSICSTTYTTGINDGDVAAITNNITSARSQNFCYDSLNRITKAQTTSTYGTSQTNCWSELYSYDEWANLTSIAAPSGSYPANPYGGCRQESGLSVSVDGNNHITSAGYTYDASGNMTATPPTGEGYTYNAESEITVANMPGGAYPTYCYTYDGDGQRIQKAHAQSGYNCQSASPHAPVVDKIYWYDLDSNPLLETDGSGNLIYEYVFFGGTRIARRDSSSNVDYYFDDYLGTGRVVTNSSGTLLDDADFYPYGGERDSTGPSSGNAYKFMGKERDAESGLDDFGARYYSSLFGRFVSADWSAIPEPVPYATFNNPQTLNLYAIVHDNPETFADLDGHDDDVPFYVKDENSTCAVYNCEISYPNGQSQASQNQAQSQDQNQSSSSQSNQSNQAQQQDNGQNQQNNQDQNQQTQQNQPAQMSGGQGGGRGGQGGQGKGERRQTSKPSGTPSPTKGVQPVRDKSGKIIGWSMPSPTGKRTPKTLEWGRANGLDPNTFDTAKKIGIVGAIGAAGAYAISTFPEWGWVFAF